MKEGYDLHKQISTYNFKADMAWPRGIGRGDLKKKML